VDVVLGRGRGRRRGRQAVVGVFFVVIVFLNLLLANVVDNLLEGIVVVGLGDLFLGGRGPGGDVQVVVVVVVLVVVVIAGSLGIKTEKSFDKIF
jgi:hypothetical protein